MNQDAYLKKKKRVFLDHRMIMVYEWWYIKIIYKKKNNFS